MYDIVVGAVVEPSAHHHHFWFTVRDAATGQFRPWTYIGVSTFDDMPALLKAKASEDTTLSTTSWKEGMIFHQRVD